MKEKKAIKAEYKAKRKEWKASLAAMDKPERSAQKKAFRAFKRRKARTRRLCIWAAVLLVVVLIGYSLAPIVSSMGAIMALEYTPNTPAADAARQNGAVIAELISDEGIVLLKNDTGL